MKLSKRQITLILMLLFTVFLIIYYFVLYPRQKSKDEKAKAKVESLSREVEAVHKNLEKEKGALEVLLGKGGEIQFFPTHGKTFKSQIPFFLEQINQSSLQGRVRIEDIEPLTEEIFDNYIKYPFRISLQGKFADLIRFVNYLEKEMKLNLNLFDIKAKEKHPGQITAECIFSAYELKGKDILARGELKIPRTKRASQKVAVVLGRDPFSLGTKVVALKRKPKSPFEKKYTLRGILRFKERYRALINDGVYKEGDRIEGRVIKEISEDRVIFQGNFMPMIMKKRR